MDWLWRDVLLLLGLIPLFIVLYVGALHRRRRFAVRYSSLSLVNSSIFQPSWLRKHLPFILFLAALTSLVLAMARPITPEAVLSGQTTIILTLDISRSMCMRDITPNRLEVARATALSFIQQPVLGTQVGIVAFAGFAELAQKPTNDLKLLENTLTTLTTATETAIGSAILRSLDAIAEVDQRVAPSEEIDLLSAASPEQPFPSKPLKAHYVPHIIVLLTDGASNTGPSPLMAAQQAAERGVRIYSIGFGTTRAAVMDCWNLAPVESPSSPVESKVGSGRFGNGPDETTLKQIAEITGGEFYSATSALELQAVFQELHNFIAETNKTIEVSVFFAAVGAMIALIAFLLATLWHPLL
ncbi:MAG TPA: VWA domain-containing protein [Anaerolineales bacterium]|nr:VWA domain-containing protein [Anaerolineales bacterium]